MINQLDQFTENKVLRWWLFISFSGMKQFIHSKENATKIERAMSDRAYIVLIYYFFQMLHFTESLSI